MSFLNFARTAARNVGKGLHTARRVGKAINGLNRTVVKMSGGKLDPLKKLQEVGENALQNAGISKEIIGRVKDGYAAGEKMYRNVQGGNYEDALRTGHNYARQQSSQYDNIHNNAVRTMDKYGMREPMERMYKRHGRKHLRKNRKG